MPNRLRIVHIESLDPKSWARDHRNGTAPGASPYGLHALGDHGMHVSWEAARAAGRNPVGWLPLVGPGGRRGAPGAPSETPDVAIAWDERTVPALVGTYGRSSVTGAGLIWVIDQLLTSTHRTRTGLLQHCYRTLDFVWCNSSAQVPLVREWIGRREGPRVDFVPLGIDTGFFPRAAWPERPMIFSLGNDRHRDVATLYAALAEVLRRHPGTEVHVQTASTKPAPPGVTVHRALTTREVLEFHRRSSMVAIATRPNVHMSGATSVLEAMSTGRPVVTTSNPGMADYVEHGVTGLVSEPFDAEAMASGMSALLDDEDRAKAMGAEAAARARSRFSEDTLTAGIAAAAKRALEG